MGMNWAGDPSAKRRHKSKNNMKRIVPTHKMERGTHPRSTIAAISRPNMTKLAISNNSSPPTSSLHARYGIYNEAKLGGRRRRMTGQGWDGRMGGRMGGNMYMQHNPALSLSLPSLPAFSPHLYHHKNISSQNRSNQHDKTEGEKRAQESREGRRGEAQRKQASGKRSSLYPSTRKGGGLLGLVWFGRAPKGRRKPHKSPLFFVFIVT